MDRYKIFDLIADQKWQDVIECVQANESCARVSLEYDSDESTLALHEACKMKPPKTVISALLAANPTAIRTPGQWGYLPLHYACTSGASLDVISELIHADPRGARTPEAYEDALPLHLACMWGASEAVVAEVLAAYPEAAYVRDSAGKTPLDHGKAVSSATTRLGVMRALGHASAPSTPRSTLKSPFSTKEVPTNIFVDKHNQSSSMVERLRSQVNQDTNDDTELQDSLIAERKKLKEAMDLKEKYEKELRKEKAINNILSEDLNAETQRTDQLETSLQKARDELNKLRVNKDQEEALAASVIEQYGKDLEKEKLTVETQAQELHAYQSMFETFEQDLKTKEEYIANLTKKKEHLQEMVALEREEHEKCRAMYDEGNNEREKLAAKLASVIDQRGKELEREKAALETQAQELKANQDMKRENVKLRELVAAEREELEKYQSMYDGLTRELNKEIEKTWQLEEEVKEKNECIDQLIENKEEDDSNSRKAIAELESRLLSANAQARELQNILESERIETASTLKKHSADMQKALDKAEEKQGEIERMNNTIHSLRKEKEDLVSELEIERQGIEDLVTRDEASKIELEEIIQNLSKEKEDLFSELVIERQSLEDLVASSEASKIEFEEVTKRLRESIKAKDLEAKELKSRIDSFQRAQVALAVKAVKLEQKGQETAQVLSGTVAELAAAKNEIKVLGQNLKDDEKLKDDYERRMSKMSKWVSSMARTLDSWKVQHKHPDQLSVRDDEEGLTEAFLVPNSDVEESIQEVEETIDERHDDETVINTGDIRDENNGVSDDQEKEDHECSNVWLALYDSDVKAESMDENLISTMSAEPKEKHLPEKNALEQVHLSV